jgi:biotin operon repressor
MYGIIEGMEHIGDLLKERNIALDTKDPVVQGGFTQVPNFILKNTALSLGAKVAYAMFLSYAWHNDFCFPGQERLAKEMGISLRSTNTYIQELEKHGFIDIKRRGLGKPNLYTLKFTMQHKPHKTRQ